MTEYPMNKKVFIFDDNIEILELCTEILEDLGLEVKTSPTTNSVEEQIRHSNQVMDKLIAQTKSRNAELAQSIANLKKEKRHLASSDVKTKSQKMTREVDKRISILNEEVTLARKAADNASGNQKIALRGKISTLSHEINSLAKHKKALSTLSA